METQAVLMGWQMYQISHSPFYLGMLGLASALPALSLALFSGLMVDWFNAYWIYQGVLFLSLVSIVFAWQAKTAGALFLAAVIAGLARSFYHPSLNSLK